MRIITFNANSLRSAARLGFFDWLRHRRADVLCIQETKAHEHQLQDPIFRPRYFATCVYHDAEKKGYSGVAIYARKTPDHVQAGIGWQPMDREGRWLQADFGNLSVISLYLPSGSSGDERQRFKFRTMDFLKPKLERMVADGRDYIICGDFNIVRSAKDIRNWRSNQKHSGCLPEERAWMNSLIECGWVDTYRTLRPDGEEYTWWSQRGAARANDVGWRIDYQLVTPSLRAALKGCAIYPEPKFSDHAPYVVDYE